MVIRYQKLLTTHRDTHESYVTGNGKPTQNMHIPSLFPDPVEESGKNIFQSKMRKETVCFNPGIVYILGQ